MPIGFVKDLGTCALVLAFAQSFVSEAQTQPIKFSPDGPLRISLDEAPRLFQQCSRSAPEPEPGGTVWLPSPTEILMLERQLINFLAQLDPGIWSDPRWHLSEYRGQFAGFFQDGQRNVYASYTSTSALPDDGKAVVFCDGGPTSWGIVWNTQTGEFGQFTWNGR